MNREHGLPPRPPRYIGSSSGTKNVTTRSVKEKEPCKRTIPPPPLDFISAVKELYPLCTLDLSKVIKNAENGIIKRTKKDGSTLEINVESLARNIARHIMAYRLTFKLDEEHLRYLLGGVRLLHILCDLAYRYPKLAQVLFDDVNVGEELFDLIFFMMTFLMNLGKKIHGSSEMVLLYSALLASSMYLFTSFISLQFNELSPVLLAHPKVDQFTVCALTSVGVVISFLQVNLSAQKTNTPLKSSMDKVYLLFQICEASLQFFQSLCKQKMFREHLELCDEGVVLQLVQDIMKLPQCEDSHLMEVVYRLKSKVLFIMLCLCEVENSTFLEMSSSTTRLLELAFSAVYEVLEVLKMMFYGDFKDHPQGLLQLNAMRITEIFADDSNFRPYIVLNLTEVLMKVFTLPQGEFLLSWCSSDHESAEEDIVKDYDSLFVSGQVLDVFVASHSKKSTLSTSSPPQIPYARQRSALLVKIVANLTCFVPDLSQEENGHFINEFLECLQKEIFNLSDAVAHGGGGITAAVSRNLRSFLVYAESLIPQYLNIDDVHLFGLFYSQVEQLITPQDPNIHLVKEVDNRGQCSSPTPTPQRLSSDENVQIVTQNEGVSLNLSVAQLHQLNFMETGQNKSNGMATEDQTTKVAESSGAQSIETNRIKNVEAVNEEETVRGLQSEKKRKRNKMNQMQIDMIESALLDDPDLHRKSAKLQRWTDKLSLHGSEVAFSQLKNWLNNRRAKLARATAKDLHTPSQVNNISTKKQNNSPKSPLNEYFSPSSSIPLGTHQNDVLRICGPESSETVTISTPTSSFKRGSNVTLTNEQGEEIGNGCIHLANGTWFGKNLKELGLCVVDVNYLKVGIWSDLPHPCDASGKTFSEAEMILGRKRVLWELSKLHLIKQQIS